MPPTIAQNISAGEELLTAVRLYGSGLGQLQSLDDGVSDFFHLPLLALQQGLERWVKISLCFLHLEQHGEFPERPYFPPGKLGHNIQILLDRLVSLAYTTGFETKFSYVKQDRVYLKSKPFRAYLISLSNFGMSSKYYHLNTVLRKKNQSMRPEYALQNLEDKVLDFNPRLKESFYASCGSQEVVVQILAESRSILVHCDRALTRLLVLGALGEEAESYTGYVYKFHQLSDEELKTVEFDPFHKNI